MVGRSRRRQNAGGRGGESDPSPQSLREGIEAGCGTGHHERVSFDRISHRWLIDHIPMDKEVLRKWLKAGFLEKHVLFATTEGTPQGGIVTPPTMLQNRP